MKGQSFQAILCRETHMIAVRGDEPQEFALLPWHEPVLTHEARDAVLAAAQPLRPQGCHYEPPSTASPKT